MDSASFYIDQPPPLELNTQSAAIEAMRSNYRELEEEVDMIITLGHDDPVRVGSLGDALDTALESLERVSSHSSSTGLSYLECSYILSLQVRHLFDPDEATLIEQNLHTLQALVLDAYNSSTEASHQGRPHPVVVIRQAGRGRPKLVIDRDWLAFAVTIHSTTDIAHILNVSRPTVSKALREYGLRERGEDPFIRTRDPNTGRIHYEQRLRYTAPMSTWSDDELDNAISRLRIHYPRSGVSMLWGALRVLGQRVPRERISASLLRLDPLNRVWGRVRIERRVYQVPGPNFLWHHDGQHGTFPILTIPDAHFLISFAPHF